jgi:hypothetical protein
MHNLRFEVIIVVVQVGAVKIYAAAAVEALRKEGLKQDETQFITKTWCIYEVQPSTP